MKSFFSLKDSSLIINIFSCPGQGWPEATPRGRALTGIGKYENPHETMMNHIFMSRFGFNGFICI
jgi:hypothetical protein